MRFLFILVICITNIGCSNYIDESLPPEAQLEFIEEFECWPYEIKKYSVRRFTLDFLYKYPSQKYYQKNIYKDYSLSKWRKYVINNVENIDYFIEKNEEDCSKMIHIYDIVEKGFMYYSGIYLDIRDSEERYYDTILFLDTKNMILYEYKHNHIW